MSRYDRSDEEFARTRGGYVSPVPAPAKSRPPRMPDTYAPPTVRAGFVAPPKDSRLMDVDTEVTGVATGESFDDGPKRPRLVMVKTSAPPRREGAMAPGRAAWPLDRILRQYVPDGLYLPVGLPGNSPGRHYARAFDEAACGATAGGSISDVPGACILQRGHERGCEIGVSRPPGIPDYDLWEDGKIIDTRGEPLTLSDIRDAHVIAEYGDGELGPGYPR